MSLKFGICIEFIHNNSSEANVQFQNRIRRSSRNSSKWFAEHKIRFIFWEMWRAEAFNGPDFSNLLSLLKWISNFSLKEMVAKNLFFFKISLSRRTCESMTNITTKDRIWCMGLYHVSLTRRLSFLIQYYTLRQDEDNQIN